MKNDSMLKKYIYNGETYDTSDNTGFKECKTVSIYEVLRVKKGVVLFRQDHLDRLKKSVEMIGFKMNKSKQEISDEIDKLVSMNDASNHNIKLVCNNLERTDQDFLTYITEGSYNLEDVPKEGAKAIIFKARRDNPNIKAIDSKQRDLINKELEEQDALEALLEDEEGNITEGSRSNMFFVKNDKLYTAPSSKVLLGITRSKIIEICKEYNIEIVEEDINKSELDNVDGIFMSTTPIGVLPILAIDDKKLNSANNEIIRKVVDGYEELTEKYIKEQN